MAAVDVETAKRRVVDAVEGHAELVLDVSHRIHERPELLFEEHLAAELVADALTELGVDIRTGRRVERVERVETGGRIQVGMEVVGANANPIGRVKEVRHNDFLVDRRMQRDIYVPITAVRDVLGGRVVLAVPNYQVDNMGWPTSSLAG